MKYPDHRRLAAFILLLSSVLLTAEEGVNLQFVHTEGQVLHADALVDERVYINGFLSHRAEIDEFSASIVRDVTEEGSGILDASFRTVERVGGVPGMLEWISSETVRLERDVFGLMSVPADAARPVLRNVPRFPGYPVKPGDTWSLTGEEVHVFRIGNILCGPYRGPVQVFYRYIDNSLAGGRRLARILIEYSIYLPVRNPGEPIRLISGHSSQELLWDIDSGLPEAKTEDFEFMMVMADGRTQEFTGRGKTSYRITESLNRRGALKSLQSELQEVPGVTIGSTEEGILLSLTETDRILFQPESSTVSADQRFRLEELARSLSAYSDRDILITGHTAGYGSFEGRKRLSRDRAAAVADILFPRGRSGPGRLFLRGAGNSEALGSDQVDRRVEILILD